MSKEAKKDIRTAVFWAFLFMAGVFMVSNVLKTYLPEGLKEFNAVIMQFLVCAAALFFSRKSMPKHWLTGTRNPLMLRSFLFLLGLISLCYYINLAAMIPLQFLDTSTLEKFAEQFNTLDNSGGVERENLILLGFGAPIFEELMFRGVVAGRMKKYGSVFFFIMSTVLFALQHANPLQLVTTFLPGLILCYLGSTYSIKWSMLLHFINNCLLGLLLPAFLKNQPVPFLQTYGTEAVRIILIVIGLLCGIGLKPAEKFKTFIHEVPNQKGCWKAGFLNIWFILMILIMVLITAAIVWAALSL